MEAITTILRERMIDPMLDHPRALSRPMDAGDWAAIAPHINNLTGLLRAYAVKTGAHVEDSQDLAQDTLAALISNPFRFTEDGAGCFESYACLVLRNRTVDRLRRRKLEEAARAHNHVNSARDDTVGRDEGFEDPNTVDPSVPVMEAEARATAQGLARNTLEARAIALLLEGWTVGETAEATRYSLGFTAKIRTRLLNCYE